MRDPDPVNRLVAEQVRPTDWVYSEYEAYYPAKKAAAVLFLPPYAGLTPEMEGTEPPLSAADRDAVDLLILKPPTEGERSASSAADGRWSASTRRPTGAGQRSPPASDAGGRPYER